MIPPTWTKDSLKLWNADCMEIMRQFPDKHFDLAIVDPPYGIGIAANPVRQMHDRKKWDTSIPSPEYFTEIGRVSKDQIIWGGNYFPLPPSQGFVIWDKGQPEDFSLAMCEYAWTSLQTPAKMFRRSVLAEKDKIHPTQKPVALYRWLLAKYAKPGMRILDTHLGSGSHAIAAHYAGMDFTGIELDADYFAAACERIDRETAQADIFTPASPAPAINQQSLAL